MTSEAVDSASFRLGLLMTVASSGIIFMCSMLSAPIATGMGGVTHFRKPSRNDSGSLDSTSVKQSPIWYGSGISRLHSVGEGDCDTGSSWTPLFKRSICGVSLR